MGSTPTARPPSCKTERTVQAVRDHAAAPVVDLHGVRASHSPDGRDDLPQVGTSLHLWFYAMYLMTSTRCGISAKQLERELGVTYKTAWRMFHLIRNELMTNRTNETAPRSGAVEVDETYVGGGSGKDTRGPWHAAPSKSRKQCAG